MTDELYPSWAAYLIRKRNQFGSKFSTRDLNKQFIPYFSTAERIEVLFSDKKVRRGYLGITTGWRPVFLLMKKGAYGSSTIIDKKAKLIRILS